MKQSLQFPTTILTTILATLVVSTAIVGDINIIPLSSKAIERINHNELDEIALSLLLVGVGVVIDLVAQRARHRAEIEARRQRVFRATITTVEDIVNSLLTQWQLVRFYAEDRLPPDTSAVLNILINDAVAKLKALSDIDEIIEMPMRTGLGIEYQEPGRFAESTHD